MLQPQTFHPLLIKRVSYLRPKGFNWNNYKMNSNQKLKNLTLNILQMGLSKNTIKIMLNGLLSSFLTNQLGVCLVPDSSIANRHSLYVCSNLNLRVSALDIWPSCKNKEKGRLIWTCLKLFDPFQTILTSFDMYVHISLSTAIEGFVASNVCFAEKVTKCSSVWLLCLVTFSA